MVSPERRVGVEVALIGEGPGDDECKGPEAGRCFVGPAGWELDKTLSHAGIARSEVAIENAHGCARDDKGGAREVRAVEACRDRVREFLDGVRPRGVLLLGGKALRSIAPSFVSGGIADGLLRHRGSLWHRREVEAANSSVGEPSILPESVEWVMTTIHPAAIIRRERLEKQPAMAFRAIPALDLRRLIDAVRKGRELLPLPEVEFHPPYFKSGEGFVFDLETDSARRPWLIGVQGLDGGPVFSLRWEREGRRWAEENMPRPDVRKVAHNGQGFDFRVLDAEGIRIEPPFEDTMAMAGLCEPDLPRGLGFQSNLYFGHRRPFWKELTGANPMKPHEVKRQTALRAAWRTVRGEKEMIFGEDVETFYNSLDCSSTLQLYNEMRETMRRKQWL